MVTWLVPLTVMLFCGLAHWLHARRRRRVAYLAFGPFGRPRGWVAAEAPLRMAAIGALCWGLIVLWSIDSAPWSAGLPGEEDKARHHLVLALDVSPSMQLADAGARGRQTRADRAREVMRSVLQRLNARGTRVSLVAFYSSARPVVIDTFDPEVIENVLNDLPLEHAFSVGKTRMYAGVEAAAEIADDRHWAPGAATLLLVSDGDTLPATELPKLPQAFGNVLIVGVGDPYHGLFIDGHSSRQDAESLKLLALQLGGVYNDANSRHVSSDVIARLTASLPTDAAGPLGRREWAIAAVLSGAVVLTVLPLALVLLGSPWNPQRAKPAEAIVKGWEA